MGTHSALGLPGTGAAQPSPGVHAAQIRLSGAGRRRSLLLLFAGLSGLVAVACGAALPFAPIAVSTPVVTWPREPARPESTLLTLTAYRPLDLDVRFTCDIARQASGVILATVLPQSPEATGPGMLVTVAAGRVQVHADGRVLLDEPLPATPCEYRVRGHSAGLPSYQVPPPAPSGRIDPGVPIARPPPDAARFAEVGNAELVVTRDGRELARAATRQLPDVDALVTSLGPLPPALAGGLSVRMRLDDEFSSVPTPAKTALTGTAAGALALTAVLLAQLDRTVPRPRRLWRPGSPRVVDVAVPAVLLLWLFVAPATDDDGYFATQAANATVSGDVGNYFQLYDHSFVPFTWVYQCLAWWQQLAGTAPVTQRVPALACGLLTWALLRRFAGATFTGGTGCGWAGRAVLATVFLAWWLPYDMGVRPEAVVAVCAAAVLLAVRTAARRERLALAWLACAVAGAAVTAHTTGVVALAVLTAGLPFLWPLLRVAGDRAATALRLLAVASGGASGLVLGFADGGLRDFLRSQTVIESVLAPDGWAEELERYAFLLDQVPMGSFARRAAVLACLVALGWFAVLAATAVARRVAVPAPLWLAGSATALALVALSFTPSKWTHHLGALAGIGSAFLALFLTLAVPLARRLVDGDRERGRPSPWLPVVAAGSVVLPLAVTWHGPNSWPYAWLEGLPSPYAPPAFGGVTLDSPLVWTVALVVVGGVLTVAGRSPGRTLAAVPIVVLVSLALAVAHPVISFTGAAAAGVPPGSIWAQGLANRDGCGAADAVQVLDPFGARPLAPADLPGSEASDGFAAGGHYAGNDPQGGAAALTWGSLLSRDGHPAPANAGTMTTAWYALPTGAAVTVLAAGSLDDGNSLTAVYGRRSGEVIGSEPLTDSARSPSWRTFRLAPPAGAEVVRLEAVDTATTAHGWLAFSAPALTHPVRLTDLLPPDAPVAPAWQVAFSFPCQRPPAVVNGVTEPPSFAVLRAPEPLGGLGDVAWQGRRGGVFAQVPRSRSVLQLATAGPVDPYLQVYVLGTELARDAYTLDAGRRVVPGADPATS